MFSAGAEDDDRSDERTLTPYSDDFGIDSNSGVIQPLARKVSELSYEEQHLAIFQAEDHIFQLPETPFARKSGVFSEFLQNHATVEQSEHFRRGDSYSLRVNGHSVYILLGVTVKEAQYFLTALYDAG